MPSCRRLAHLCYSFNYLAWKKKNYNMQTHHNLRQDYHVLDIWLELFDFFVCLVEILVLLTAILFVNHTSEPILHHL